MADPLAGLPPPREPQLVVRKSRPHGGGRHGGAWKVAYADFVTAMMAFFLLLWLLNVTTDDQRRGIAEYFAPESVSRSTSGAGHILAGHGLSEGAMPRDGEGFVLGIPQQPVGGESNAEISDTTEPPPARDIRPPYTDAGTAAAEIDPAALEEWQNEQQEREFAEVEARLAAAVARTPELQPLKDNLVVDRTPEGLRIQLVDQERREMFALGSAEPNPHLQTLMTLVAGAVAALPNPISITGHTDARPYAPGAVYTNWELSLDRANASRRALIAAGLDRSRIVLVRGKAATEPLVAGNPADPRNRRIAIVLRRDLAPPGASMADAATPGDAAPAAVPSPAPASHETAAGGTQTRVAPLPSPAGVLFGG